MYAFGASLPCRRFCFCSLMWIAVCILALNGVGLGQGTPPGPVARPLITQAVNEGQVTKLKGNTHPLARPEFDLGSAPATLPMQRMLLVLKRSPEQQLALRKLLDDQQDRHSPNYHKWLTPEEFGQKFGPTDADMQAITGWLQAHGFQVGTTKGRTVLEFSGSASQVRETFHTAIHKYIVNGEQHWANASDPQIPAALVPAIAGVATLHNFVSRPQSHWSSRIGCGATRTRRTSGNHFYPEWPANPRACAARLRGDLQHNDSRVQPLDRIGRDDWRCRSQ